MQMQDQNKINNNKTKRLKKSHLLLIGSFLVFIGLMVLFYHHLLFLKGQVFDSMEILMADATSSSNKEEVVDVPPANNISDGTAYQETTTNNNINYNKYLGVLEIPKVSLKRGFYNTDSKYNSIEYNVTLVRGSTMPNVNNGNLILMAHSGDAYISYFAYLYRLKIGDFAYITYQGNKYKYRITNIYEVPKNGKAVIYRNYNQTTLTLITCTKNDDFKQTIYIAELVS